MSDVAVDVPKLKKRRLPQMQELGLVVVIITLYVLLTIAGHVYKISTEWNAFLNLDNQINGIGQQMSIYCIMAVGMTAVIITGGIDISVGAIMGVAALAGARVVQNLPVDSPWYVAIPVAFLVPMAVGGLCGLANGAMTVGFRMHPFIVTLSTMSMLQGIAVLWFPSTVPEAGKQLPGAFVRAMSAEITVGSGTSAIGLRWVPVFVMLVVVAIGAVFLHGLVAGRETYAIGGNPEAARFSGIRVWWVTMRVYILMGLCAGVAAVVHLGKFNSTSTNDGRGYELLVIASAVVGGASLTGGRGTALGALLGTLVITLIDNGITVMHWATENTKVIIGAAIIVAVGIDRFSDYMARRGGRR